YYIICVKFCLSVFLLGCFFFFQAEDGIRDPLVTGVQTCALPISAFAVSTDYALQKIVVGFKVPDSPGSSTVVPVRLDVNIGQVATALYGPLTGKQEWRLSALEQAERVAWRHLVLWVDAACSASSAGMQTMAEAFFAHVLVKADNGAQGRMFDHWTEHGGAKLLAAGEATSW